MKRYIVFGNDEGTAGGGCRDIVDVCTYYTQAERIMYKLEGWGQIYDIWDGKCVAEKDLPPVTFKPEDMRG